MTAEEMTAWLQEKKPAATVHFEGVNEDDIHLWRLEFTGGKPPFVVGVPEELLDHEGVLAERLMEMETQGWLDRAGEEEHRVVLTLPDLAQED